VRAEELVAQVAVAVLDVNEVEAGLAGEARRRVEVFDDPPDLAVGEQGASGARPTRASRSGWR
jgi:hypothetical protein